MRPKLLVLGLSIYFLVLLALLIFVEGHRSLKVFWSVPAFWPFALVTSGADGFGGCGIGSEVVVSIGLFLNLAYFAVLVFIWRKLRFKTSFVRACYLVGFLVVIGIAIGVLIVREPERLRRRGFSTSIQLSGFRMSLEAYKAEKGNYPTTSQGLNSLLGGYFDKPAIPKDPWGNAYQYSGSEQKGFKLCSNGPDKEPTTDDDICITEKE